jgi:acetyl esterase/lipase
MGGSSAGGHLAALLAVRRPEMFTAAVLWYPVTDTDALINAFDEDTCVAAVGTYDAGAARRWSPLHLVDGRCPPVLTIQGAADAVRHTTLAGARRFHARLDELGVDNELFVVAGADHAFDVLTDGWSTAAQALLSWLDAHQLP